MSFNQFFRSLFGRKRADDIPAQEKAQTTHPAAAYSRSVYYDYTHLYNEEFPFAESFYSDLRRTISWTETIVTAIEDKADIDYLRVLRTTNPIYDGKPFYTYFPDGYSVAVPEIPFDYDAVLKAALSERPEIDFSIDEVSSLGKVLRFEIDQTTHDGAPTSMNGFVDDADIPPIDTWFYLTKKYLYCWIPALFIGAMQDAIDVEIMLSYEWLEDIDPQLYRKIEEIISTTP